MEKLITYPGRSDRGIFTYVIDTESPFLIKTAAEYHPEIAAYINAAKKIPGKTQILLTALGAGEYWGSNANGDYFSEAALAYPGPEYGYRTFTTHAKIYKHHVNKNPAASFGDVKLSVYNPIFHRVELIVILDDSKAPDIADKVNNGVFPDWSMGCRVKYDVCSICGNRARTRAEYCEHLRYYMGKIDPTTGKMVYAINPEPVFFDISQVFIGADRVAKTLKKVASLSNTHNYKEAEIKKEVPVETPPASIDLLKKDINFLHENDPDIPKEVLNSVSEKHPLKDVISTLLASRIVPRPHEFQRIVLVSLGHKPIADHWDSQQIHFDPERIQRNSDYERTIPVSYDHMNEDVLREIEHIIPQRSFLPHHMMGRVTVLVKRADKKQWKKIASEKDPRETSTWSSAKQIALAAIIATLYHKVMKNNALQLPSKGLAKAILGNNTLASALGFSSMVAPIFFNRTVGASQIGNKTNMAEDAHRQNYVERQLSSTKVASRAGVGTALTFGLPIATGLTSNYLQKKRMVDPEYNEGSIKSFIRRYKEPAQLLGAAVGLGLLTNRPIPTKLYNIAAAGLKSVEKAIPHVKMGSINDFALDTLIWPLASGGPHLAKRLVGSAIDQTVIEGIRRLSNKSSKDKLS